MSEQATLHCLNGVDIDIVHGKVAAMEETPELAKFKFRLHNRWLDGGHNISSVWDFYGAKQETSHLSGFTMVADEPLALAGKDLAANPVEHLLHALAGCLTSTLVYHAALHNIKIEELESQLEGDIDMRGFLGLSKDVRPGYENIRVVFTVRTDEENVEKLKELSKMSPVFDVISNGTNVDVQIERK